MAKNNQNRIVAWLTLDDLALAGRTGKLSGGATALVSDVEYYFTEDTKYYDEEPIFVNAKLFTDEELENARQRYQAARYGAPPTNNNTTYILRTLSDYGGYLETPVKLLCNEEDSGDEENPGRSIVFASTVSVSGAFFYDQFGTKYASKDFTVDNEEIILKYCEMLNE